MTPAQLEQAEKDKMAPSYALIGFWRKEGPSDS